MTHCKDVGRRVPSSLRAGTATIEFVVCLPTILLIVLASIECSSMIFLQQSLTVASYEGALLAARKNATTSDVQGGCNSVLTTRRVTGAIVTIAPTDVATVATGTRITVEVSASCAANAFMPAWFFGGRTLVGTCTMLKE